MIHVTLTFYKFSHTYSFVEIYYDKVEEYFNFEPSLQHYSFMLLQKVNLVLFVNVFLHTLSQSCWWNILYRPIEQKVHLLLKLRCVIIITMNERMYQM